MPRRHGRRLSSGCAVDMGKGLPDGGIGRRRGLKIPRSKGCEGSNPSPGTNKIKRLQLCDRFIFWFFRITIPENKHQRRRPGYVRRRPGMNSLPESPAPDGTTWIQRGRVRRAH